MNTYQIINDVLFDLKTTGKETKAGRWQSTDDFKDYDMLVLRNIILKVNMFRDIKTKEALRDYTKADQPWSEMHFLERINEIPSNPGETYKFWPYATFDEGNDPYLKGKKFSHTYQERFWPKMAGGKDSTQGYMGEMIGIRFEYGDLNNVINILKENPLTRQAYLPIWFPEDTWAADNGERVPCTLGYYFWIENGRLYMNYTIRSCDAFRHFRNDVYLTGRLLIYVAKQLKLELGELTIIIYNLHLFKNDIHMMNNKELRLRNF